jgi:hypothetical protein
MASATDPGGASPGADEQQSFMGRFQELFSLGADSGITLTNMYQELPITHPASISDIRGCHLELCTSELQLAAISQCQEVYIRSPHFDSPVLARMEGIDVRRGLVRLADFAYVELQEDRRETVRVRFKRPTNIIIHSGSTRISGVVHDISLGGCRINTLTCKGLEESDDIQVELKVIDQATGLPNCRRIPCTPVYISGETPPFKCVFRFHHDQQTEEFLSRLINQRQVEILRELRETL